MSDLRHGFDHDRPLLVGDGKGNVIGVIPVAGYPPKVEQFEVKELHVCVNGTTVGVFWDREYADLFVEALEGTSPKEVG